MAHRNYRRGRGFHKLTMESLEAKLLLAGLSSPIVGGAPGDAVTVPVAIDETAGFLSALIRVDFDGSVVSVSDSDVQLGSALSGASNTSLLSTVVGNSIQILINTPVPLAAGTGNLLDITYHVDAGAPDGFTPIDLVDGSTVLNGGQLSADLTDGGINVMAAVGSGPEVTGVSVGSSVWFDTFTNFLGTDGVAVPPGDAPLPWINLDTIYVQFNETAHFFEGDFALIGSEGTVYSVDSTSGSGTDTATLNISPQIGRDKLRLIVRDSVANADRAPLEGGDFDFRFDVMPGDVNRSSDTSITDFVNVSRRFTEDVTDGGFSIHLDVNGTGVVDLQDLIGVLGFAFQNLGDLSEPGDGSVVAAIIPADSPITVEDLIVAPVSEAPVQDSLLLGLGFKSRKDRRVGARGDSAGTDNDATDTAIVDLTDGGPQWGLI